MECELESITIHYEMIGEGRPIILLHGYPLDHRYMVHDMEPFFEHREGWKRIYPDLPGMGKTPGADWITTQDQILDIVLDFIDQVIPGQRFVVAGASYGGYLARGVIHADPRSLTDYF
jgi:pimeloyl-ACP methyl ester carboxylesterase